MRNWALVALAAFLPRRPAPGLLGDDVEVDRRRPRTLVEDFIKDARPYESALPAGVEPAAEVLQHFPETSFERCPELEAFTEKIRAASTSPEMLAHLDKVEDGLRTSNESMTLVAGKATLRPIGRASSQCSSRSSASPPT